MSELHFAALGESAAAGLESGAERPGRGVLAPLRAALSDLRRQRQRASEDGAARWLLDNWYLAEREGREALEALSKAKHLRACGESTVLFHCCGALLEACDGGLTAEALEGWLTGFQRALPLSQAEHAMLLPALKAALVISLASLFREEAPEDAAVGCRFTALRTLSSLDLSPVLERTDALDRLLRRDPAGVYPKMDRATRAQYRAMLARQARRQHVSETAYASTLLERANRSPGAERHIGFALLQGERPAPTGRVYALSVALLTVLLALLLGLWTKSLSCGVLLLLPLSELIKQGADALLQRVTPPRFVPRLELEHGVPKAGQTLCVVSALLTKPEDGEKLAARLEAFRLCSRDALSHLRFGLLADLKEGRTETLREDADCLRAARDAVSALNEKYGGGFYLFTRPRAYAKADGVWRGYERKRGAILSLAALLRGRKTTLCCAAGDPEALIGTKYLLTLDADTSLTPGAAREMIGAMLHPLNTPRIDPERKVVTAGYALLHPRIATELESATATDFARLFAGPGGTDPYGGSCGELMMDRFDCGGFAGKGILDVDALLGCCADFPAERILSHDALEGAFLRGGYLGDTELTDGFPAAPLSYWVRLERWTRGDWQNLPWLFARGRALRPVDRLRLLDSLRRSLIAPGTFLAIAAGLLLRWPGLRLAAWAALISLLSGLLLSLGQDVLQPGSDHRARHYGVVIHGLALSLLQAVLRLVFLPFEAWLCLSAAVRALWRTLLSHKRCLAWQTAAQSEAAKHGSIPDYYRAMLPAAVAGILFLLLAPTAAGKTAGALWLFSPLLARTLSRPKAAAAPLSKSDRAYLLGCAGEIWRYFEDFCTEEDHFLPPDNWQAHPPAGAAHRTSPTNLGLGLISALCADALGVDGGRGLPLAERMLEAMETLPRWKGHFYNWYHTITLKPLQPAYVSTVDSGNLAACLTAAAGALRARERRDLAQRAEALLAPMDFKPLYDPSRRLFRIGIDARTGEPSPGWYDLLSSEARLTGYLAIARGDADKRHWRSLSRAQVQLDRYRGMASWTGTMFEYLMPELFLPLAPESLLWESAKFCLYAQKKRPPRGLPWGVSESGFYSLDPSLHYRYKAHGVGALALCRGMDRELVLSPYSSFLALLVEPRAAVRNLRRLEKLGLRGPYGFWEAMDCTPARCRGAAGEIVRSVMAHHLGMSLAAVANVLLEGAVHRWTMADPAMRAHQSLLQERVPLGGPLLRRRQEPKAEPPRRQSPATYRREGTGTDAAAPAGCLLSNGSLHLPVFETGAMLPRWEGRALLSAPPKLRLRKGSDLLPLFPLTGGEAAQWVFTPETAEVRAEWENLAGTLSAAVSETAAGCLITLTLMARADLDAQLELALFPALARAGDYESHPAFWRLGILEKRRDGSVLWQRLPRGEHPGLWMALACDTPPEDSAGSSRWLWDGRSLLRWVLSLRAGETCTRRFALGAGAHQEAAYHAAQQTLAMPRAAFSALPAQLASQLGLESAELGDAMALTGPLAAGTLREQSAGAETRKREALWALGLSVTLPILAAPLETERDRAFAPTLLRQHALLHDCGLDFDLVFLGDDGGDYRRPNADFLRRALAALDREEQFQARGGVHFAANADVVRANAALIAADGAVEIPARNTLPLLSARPDRRDLARTEPQYRRHGDGAFSVRLDRTLPRRAWCQMLTNGRFSCTATDSGSGDLWFQNAREGRITPWRNDPWAVSGPERLEDGAQHSLFANGENEAGVLYRFGSAVWETRRGDASARVTAFIPMDTDARILLIETSAPTTLRWRLDLLLAGEEADASALATQFSDGVFTAVNPRAAAPFLLTALCSGGFSRHTASRAAADRGQMDGFTGSGVPGCFCAELSVTGRAVLVVGTAPVSQLRALTSWDVAHSTLRETEAFWAKFARRFSVSVPDGAFQHYVSGWAAYQAMACRLLGRSSLYQSGGAVGFRDQLQDAVNLLLLGSGPARRQILSCCAHQFSEGDVCHWWHMGAGREQGVRTRIADDLLWLPWALAEYTEKVGDLALCAERTPWLFAPPLEDTERERYAPLAETRETGSVLEHAVRAVQCILRRGTGDHGLLRMGAGDWNDGFDRVEGESVWLSFFFSHTVHRLADLLDALGADGGDAMRAAAQAVGAAAEQAYDGAWYRRGYYADGTPLGSRGSDACRIDAIAQSWAVLCPETDPAHRSAALSSALDRLFDLEHRLVRLLEPPFRSGGPDPGYVRSYGPGFRENGGQYTHGGVWLAMALLREGRADEGFEVLRALLPASHDGETYEAEPFVLAADVYAGDAPETAGWTWYTGAAGWYLRVAAEDLFGLRLRGGQLFLDAPHLPAGWGRVRLRWRDGAGKAHTVEYGPEGPQVDGAPYDGGAIGTI